ncbi:hypothetical protein JRQ81_003698 [Phrynocephalus forsythii]|uniref:lysozyme n=1 Tax=Phrynocephalus forsythii TaxID=171643 RepID=A0A9Q1AXG0_9SAUR|nr:hypothetical protein JRQ81_003698 [Phrynocephalus forsythii]
MKTLLVLGLSLFVALVMPGAEAKVFERCELARELKRSGFDKVGDWVCLVEHESRYNTAAINDNGRSRDYGIFQINSQYWCDDGKTQGSKNMCHISCSKFLDDDIRDDMKCAKLIAQQARGLTPCLGHACSAIKKL